MSREWVTVPAEPTPEMVEEICRSHTTEEWPNAFGASAQEIRRDYARAGWAAALAAAPHPPIAQPDVLRAAAEKARAALSDLLLKRDPIVYSDALRALDEALAQAPIAQPQAAPTTLEDGKTQLPAGWVPLRIEHEPGYPEDVAFGPQRMMDRLKKWLDRYFGILAQPQAAGWRPIETAPRDGTRIMVSNGIGVWFAEWHQFASSGFRFADPWRSMMLNHDHIEHPHRYKAPTRWQPLPEPPKEGA